MTDGERSQDMPPIESDEEKSTSIGHDQDSNVSLEKGSRIENADIQYPVLD